MMRDNQGRALLRLPTTMRAAFWEAYGSASARALLEAAYGGEDANLAAINTVGSALRSNHGYRKVPAWTVTRRTKR